MLNSRATMNAILEKVGDKANSVKLDRNVNPKTMIVRQPHFHDIPPPNKNIIIPGSEFFSPI